MYWKFTEQGEELFKAGSEETVSSYTLHMVSAEGLSLRLDWGREGYMYEEAGRRSFDTQAKIQDKRMKNSSISQSKLRMCHV